MPNILYYLINDYVIFDYATRYCLKHPTAAPLEKFEITDEDYADFKEMVKEKKFTYDRQSETILKNLKEIAEFEGYMDDASEEFKALENKLTHNLDRDLDHFKKEIKSAIENEVVKRYYYQRGGIVQQLKDDPDLKKAIEVLNDPKEYRRILGK